LHVGGGSFVNVNGYYDGGMPGLTLKYSGRSTGSVTGTYLCALTGQTVGGYYMDKIEVMTPACSTGDSGGPVYAYYNSKYKVVGIISASGEFTVPNVGKVQGTIYTPCSEVKSKLGITPLTE
jgi:hypothetical protein